jgi:hypothetical protein
MAGGEGAQNELQDCEFWAQFAGPGRDGSTLLRVQGKSNAEGRSGYSRGDDGRLWRHDVKLDWHGYVEMRQDRMARLLLVAQGSEYLEWGNIFQNLQARADVTQLPGGHAFDLSCGVRYGIIGETVASEDAGGEVEADGTTGTAQVPAGIERQLAEVMGGEFVVFRDLVQDELKLSGEQRRKLSEKFGPHIQATMQLFERIKDLKPEDRERELQKHRQKSAENLSGELGGLLDAGQHSRLFQIQLQREGVFALLGQNEAFLKLNVTDEQRREFKLNVQAMQEAIQPLIKEAQLRGNPEGVGAKVMQIRKVHEGQIKAILTPQQKEQWRTLLGNRFDLDD